MLPTADETAEDLYDNAPCGYFSTLADGTLVRVNQTLLNWTGYGRADLVRRARIHALLGAGSRIYYETHVMPLLQMQGAAHEIALDLVRADGTQLPVIVNSVLLRGAGDGSALVRTTVFDATDRRRYERELLGARREAERLSSERDVERRRLAGVLDLVREAVITFDCDLRARFVNHAGRKVQGLGEVEVGQPLPDVWEEFSLRAFAAALFQKEQRPLRVEYAPTAETWYSIAGVPPNPAGEAMIVLTDLSEVSRRERAEREFVANAAHELRTPLTGILGAVDVLQRGAKEITEDRDLFLENIEREARRLDRLTRALLLLAELQESNEPAPVEPIDVRSLLDETASGLDVHPDVAVEVECPPGLRLRTNPDLVGQAVTSVAANAAKYTRSGRISLSASVDDDGVTIVVTDTGPGIPPEHEPRLFDRFYRVGARDHEGAGLGLSIASQAIQSLGGTIELRRPPRGGTAVELRLPARDGRPLQERST